ncbi:MAG: TIGR03621 family F420-dependent LLM class oxidoreductase [Thermomicrobiales bacterium]
MPVARPFRFVTGAPVTASVAEYTESARRVEALGYSTFTTGDHFVSGFEAGPAMTAAALATSTLHVTCTVFDNDFRHPALLAKVAATVDVLSGGRLELGIGAGWRKSEYDQVGIPFDPPGVRVSRMEEAVHIIKGLWSDGPFTFSGRHYTISELDGVPKPVQRPHPPIFIGGGGKRLLSFAAREADIVGLLGQALPGGGLDMIVSEAALAEKVGWVRAAAGERFDQLELSMLMWSVVVTDNRHSAAERLADSGAGGLAARLAGTRGVTAEQVLACPYFLIGSIEQIVEQLLALRARHGISYIEVFSHDMEAFAPVVARLAGQ